MAVNKSDLLLQLAQARQQLKHAQEQVAELEALVYKDQPNNTPSLDSRYDYSHILDNLLEGAEVIGFDWRYLYVNDTVVGHGRQQKDVLLRSTVLELYPGIEQTAMFASFRICMEQRIPQHFQTEFVFPDGGSSWFELSVQPIPEGIFILSLDITERKRVEKTIERYAKRMEILHQIDSGIIEAGSIETVVEVVLRNLHALIPFERGRVSLVDKAKMEATVFVADENVTTVGRGTRIPLPPGMLDSFGTQNLRVTDDLRIKHADNPIYARLINDGLVSLLECLLIAPTGIVGVLALGMKADNLFTAEHQEIAAEIGNQLAIAIHQMHLSEALAQHAIELEQKVQERTEQLRQSEMKFSKAFRASPAAISIATLPEGRWIELNDALINMTGYSREELIGRTSMEVGLVDPSVREKIIDAIQREGKVRNVEIQMVTKTRELIDVLLSTEQMEVNGQNLSLTVQYDITALKRAEREVKRLNEDLEKRQVALQAVNNELEAFSYSISHDLRSPLRTIDGFSAALESDYGEILDDDAKDFLRRIRTGTQRMAQLIDALLKLSKLTRAEMRHEVVDLSAIVQQAVDDLRESDSERVLEIVIAPDIKVVGDTSLLRVMLVNLVNNAWKFTSKTAAARVEFGETLHEGVPTYFVRDNGAGFDMLYANNLFGAFQRLHKATDFEGTGIGLATVQRIMNRHGGKVWAESVVNQGATFYFSFQV